VSQDYSIPTGRFSQLSLVKFPGEKHGEKLDETAEKVEKSINSEN
jgi:hypothetical protein